MVDGDRRRSGYRNRYGIVRVFERWCPKNAGVREGLGQLKGREIKKKSAKLDVMTSAIVA